MTRPAPFKEKTATVICELCRREVDWVTQHHLVPRARKKRGAKGKNDRITVRLCKSCHDYIHSVLTATEIWRDYYTIERLLGHEKIRGFVKWLRGKPPEFQVTSKRLKRR